MLDRFFNPNPTFYKWDKFWVGFIPSLFLPLLAFPFFYLIKFHYLYTFVEYLHQSEVPERLVRIISFGCVLNLAFFFLLINNDRFNAGRGVIAATIIYGLAILYIKFAL